MIVNNLLIKVTVRKERYKLNIFTNTIFFLIALIKK